MIKCFICVVVLLLMIWTLMLYFANIKLISDIKSFNNFKKRHCDEFTIVTLCGSTRFKKEFEEIQRDLTLKGYLVISVGCFDFNGTISKDSEKTKKMLDKMHKRKIDLADVVVIVNKDNYIGESTKSEIKYAKEHYKTVVYYY